MKLTVTTFLTVDGVMQAPGGADEDRSGGFDQGGWVAPHFDADTGAFMNSVFERTEAFLLGRGTYEIFAAYWPTVTDPDDPIAGKLNAMPKYVASTTLDRVDWEGSSLLEGDVVQAVTELKNVEGGELQVHGSAGLAQTLIEHGLVDEYNLLTFPVVVGAGKRLFGDSARPTGLRPISQTTTGSGVRIDVWEAAGEPQLGDATEIDR
jgi:dihydrofolate reductase